MDKEVSHATAESFHCTEPPVWSKTITGYSSGRKKIHSFIMLKDTKKWRIGSGKNTLLQPGSRGLPNPESEKTKGCNLYWVKSETTAKKVKRNLPFLPHVYCLPLSRLTSLKAHFSLLITSLGYFFGHNFVQDVAFLQRAHIDFSAELGHWSPQERKHQTSI